MGTSMHVEEVGGILIVVHLPVVIADGEWDALCARLRDGDHTGVVIWSNNHPPNSRQRNVARVAVTGRTKPPANVAILSDSVVIRAVVSIINVFVGDLVSMFPPRDTAAAFAHAKVPAGRVKEITDAIERLRNAPASAKSP
jgi:hypothetical protein